MQNSGWVADRCHQLSLEYISLCILEPEVVIMASVLRMHKREDCTAHCDGRLQQSTCKQELSYAKPNWAQLLGNMLSTSVQIYDRSEQWHTRLDIHHYAATSIQLYVQSKSSTTSKDNTIRSCATSL